MGGKYIFKLKDKNEDLHEINTVHIVVKLSGAQYSHVA
jgi:hypothetical protein